MCHYRRSDAMGKEKRTHVPKRLSFSGAGGPSPASSSNNFYESTNEMENGRTGNYSMNNTSPQYAQGNYCVFKLCYIMIL